MDKKFLPERVSGALKALARRAFGLFLIIIGFWALGALVFHDPYLDGFMVASTFGNQSWMGQIISILRYTIGFIPTMFLCMLIMRAGLVRAANWDTAIAPEYNFLRGFVAICIGAAAFGLIAPSSTYGGICGAIVASDMGSVVGDFVPVFGILLLLGFFVLAGVLLHIKWEHVRTTAIRTWRILRWLPTAFHLIAPMAAQVATDDSDEDAEEESDTTEDEEYDTDDAEDSATTPARRVSRRVRSVSNGEHADMSDYQLPDPRLLEKSNFGKNVVTPELKRQAELMEVNFAQYNVRGKVVGIRPGPIVTLYEFLPDNGTRMVDINKTVDDMTRAMATEKIRIAPIPNTQYIGVEMVNLTRQTVRYRALMDNPLFTESKYKIPLALGVDIGGNPMYFDLAKMPHMLVAGRTGSGKSVFIQSLITSIVYHFTPDKCKLMIIDPKGVDFVVWENIPHLITPIVKNDAPASVNALKWAVREMDERYKQMMEFQAQNIASYNDMMAAKRAAGETVTRQVAVGTDEETGELLFEEQEVDLSDMPYIVIIIDEVADLMSIARKEVEACVQRIAAKARAAGIHLIMATQRPDTSVITGTIKANFPTRVSFQARSVVDSMTTLGEKGAEQLLACGDLLFSEGGKRPVRIHAAFIDDKKELIRIADFLRSQGEPEYTEGVTEGEGASSASGIGAIMGVPSGKEAKDADLYTQAKEYVLRDKKPTISYIQRRLGVGYNKAAGFMERMEQEGIVSAPDANNKRHIL